MRTQGSLRVVLNTKLWPNMTLEKGNEKSLRFTAMDSEKDIKIYLIMVSKLFFNFTCFEWFSLVFPFVRNSLFQSEGLALWKLDIVIFSLLSY